MVRVATVDDARAIAAVHVRGWQASYRGVLSDDHLDKLSIERRAESWAQWIPDARLAIAVDDIAGSIVGFVSAGPSRDTDVVPRTGEVMAIYVLPEMFRRGIGSALLRWAMNEAAARSWTQLTLWTLAANAGARAFYEHCGWSLDGTTKREPFAGAIVDQVRFRCVLASSPPA
jgi:GNAT superfamily N-acetyltransferase